VVLTLADGATVKASRAILTIPLGVLKTAPPMFDPELPSNMQASIQRMAYGTLNKVVLLMTLRALGCRK
jgi:monoamine oxidase